MKLCVDCKFYKAGADESQDTCLHERAARGGVRSQRWYCCGAMRGGICGTEASLFVHAEAVEGVHYELLTQ